ncbi:MAG TPA: NIF family HAD-type phosphatase [Chitinispirillaceae bacterium]|nr:NIF family HAD-type phosphatase [Chitinispirillaceae bacterium]
MKSQKTIIFDLSEVIIKGLLGIEDYLASILNLDRPGIIRSFGGDNMRALFLGNLSEEHYFQQIINANQLDTNIDELKRVVRNEFNYEIPDMASFILNLSMTYPLVLYSDHAKEWISYILKRHSFLKVFKKMVFSYEQNCLKSDTDAFPRLLTRLNLECSDVIFIDDTLENVRNAERNGICTIKFNGRFDLERTLKEII